MYIKAQILRIGYVKFISQRNNMIHFLLPFCTILLCVSACDTGQATSTFCDDMRYFVRKINSTSSCRRQHPVSNFKLERIQNLVSDLQNFQILLGETMQRENLMGLSDSGNRQQNTLDDNRNLEEILQTASSQLMNVAMNLVIIENHSCRRANTHLLSHVIKLICSTSKALNSHLVGNIGVCPSLDLGTSTKWITVTSDFFKDVHDWVDQLTSDIKRSVMMKLNQMMQNAQ